MCTARPIPESIEVVPDAARNAILHQLALDPMRPTELLNALGDEFTDFELKETVLRLLREGLVVATSDRKLTLTEAA